MPDGLESVSHAEELCCSQDCHLGQVIRDSVSLWTDGCAKMPGSSEPLCVLVTLHAACHPVRPPWLLLSQEQLHPGLQPWFCSFVQHTDHLLGFLAYVPQPSLSFAHSLLQGLSWGQLWDAAVEGQALSRPCETS